MTRALLLALLVACSPMHYVRGVPNLAQVDANVYRSGQITTTEGWDYIAELAGGRRIHVIKLNFENEGSDAIAEARGYTVHQLPIQPEGDQDIWDDIAGLFLRPSADLVQRAEILLADAVTHVATDFYLVHCTHGQDRTGLVVGEHRVLHDGWTKDDAYAEMLEHDFHWEIEGLASAWEDF